MATLIPNMLEFFYVLIGVILFSSAWRVLRDPSHPAKIGTTLFLDHPGCAVCLRQLYPQCH